MKLMEDNFNNLENNIINCILNTDTDEIKKILDSIAGNSIITGVGGSRVVATFLKRILDNNDYINTLLHIDDLYGINLTKYSNIILCSYSGRGTPTKVCLDNNLNKYLLSTNDVNHYIALKYELEKEKSFISLASTLVPITILLYYYLDVDKNEFINMIKDMFNSINIDFINNDIYEIFYNRNSITASEYLESTMVESGIAIPILHNLYSFCHGRSTTQERIDSTFIYLGSDTLLDNTLKECFNENNKNVIYLSDYCEDDIVNDYYKLLQAMFLTRLIAQNKKIDLCDIKYSSMVKKLYHFKGSM